MTGVNAPCANGTAVVDWELERAKRQRSAHLSEHSAWKPQGLVMRIGKVLGLGTL